MAMIPAAGRELLVLGAGNANDIDLSALGERFESIHLADIGGHACQSAAEQARVETIVHELELTGLVDRLPSWKEEPPQPKVLRAITEQASREVGKRLPGPFDVVTSAGLLSQIVLSALEVLGRDHVAFGPASVSLVVAHLRLALGLLRPGGTLVLAVDTAPRPPAFFDQLGDDADLSKALVELEAIGQCIPATEVGFVVSVLKHLAPGAAVTMAEPWVWRIGQDRSSLVYGLVCQVS